MYSEHRFKPQLLAKPDLLAKPYYLFYMSGIIYLLPELLLGFWYIIYI